MKIPSQRENIPLDLNLVFRKNGLAQLKKLTQDSSTVESPEVGLWSCLYLKEQPFADVTPRALLVGDSHVVAQYKKHETYLELNRKLQSFMPTLFVAQTPAALDRGALPGERTLHSPLFPSLHLKAIASARCVVSFHIEPVLVAIANRVPAIFVGGKESEEAELARRMGVPVILGTEPAKMVAEIEMYFTHYSWRKIDEFCKLIIEEMGLPEIQSIKPMTGFSLGTFNVCTITDSNYLPFFLGFIENVDRASNGNFKCHVLTLDSQVHHAIKKMKLSSKIEEIFIQDLWEPETWLRVSKRSIASRAFSSKPLLISKVLKEVSGPVFYCDSDVFFFEDVKSLQYVMGDDDVVLFPHLNDQYPAAQLDGLYNAGMIAVDSGAEHFLHWWSDLCAQECSFDHKQGLVGDQAYLNLAPILFDKVKVFKGHNHNVARWNSQTLRLDLDTIDRERPIIEGGNPVSTYHAAFCDERGVYQMKFLWDHLVSFFSPAYSLGTSKALSENVKFQQRVYWPFFDYSSKIDRIAESSLMKSLIRGRKYNPDWWFTEAGRTSLNFLISFKTLLNQLKIRPQRSNLTGPTLENPSVSEGWVQSNLKALKAPTHSTSKPPKVA